MSDPETPEPTQAPPAGDVPATPPAPEAPAVRTYSETEYQRVAREAQSLRERLRAATAQAEAAGDLGPALEAERTARATAEGELTTLRQQVEAYRLRDALEALTTEAQTGEGETARANPLHGQNARLLARLIDPAAITRNDAGEPTNLRRLAEAALRDYGLTAAQPAAPRLPAQPPAGGGGATQTAEQIAASLQAARDSRPSPLRPPSS